MLTVKYKNSAVELSDDPPALKARIRELEALLQNSELRCANLDYRLKSVLDRLYSPKTDALSPAQKLLFGLTETPAAADVLVADPPTNANPTPVETASTAPAKKSRDKRRHRKVPFPENLPEERERIDLPDEQKKGLIQIRLEVTRQIDFKPGYFFWRVIERPVYAHPKRAHAPRVMPLPPQVIPQSNLATGFIVQVVIARFADACPYYRQEGIDARSGVVISRQTRQRCAQHVAHLLISIRDQLKKLILRSRYAQVDETFNKVLDPDRPGQWRECYLWGYLAPHVNAFVLEFSLSRSSAILHEFFPRGWRGEIQSDGARMYPAAFKHRPEVTRYGCLAHQRRKIVAALKVGEERLVPVYRDIRELYRLEDRADELGFTHEQRGHLRHVRAKPILKRIQKNLWDIRKAEVERGTLFGKLKEAVDYAKNNWRQIACYARLGNGHIQIDTNRIENCFRPGKILQKNALFIAHPAAGWITAVLSSVVGTCKLLGVNAYDYLVWVLPKLATGTNRSTASGLLPHDFIALQVERAHSASHSVSNLR